MFTIADIDFKKISGFIGRNYIGADGTDSSSNAIVAVAKLVFKLAERAGYLSDKGKLILANTDAIVRVIFNLSGARYKREIDAALINAGILQDVVLEILATNFPFIGAENPIYEMAQAPILTKEEIKFNKELYEANGYKVDEDGFIITQVHEAVVPAYNNEQIDKIKIIESVEDYEMIENEIEDEKPKTYTPPSIYVVENEIEDVRPNTYIPPSIYVVENEIDMTRPIYQEEPEVYSGAPLIQEPVPKAQTVPITPTANNKPDFIDEIANALNVPKEYVIIGGLVGLFMLIRK